MLADTQKKRFAKVVLIFPYLRIAVVLTGNYHYYREKFTENQQQK